MRDDIFRSTPNRYGVMSREDDQTQERTETRRQTGYYRRRKALLQRKIEEYLDAYW